MSSAIKRTHFSRFSARPMASWTLGKRDDVPDLTIRPPRCAVAVQFVDSDGLLVPSVAGWATGLRLTGGRVFGARLWGRERHRC